MKSIKLTASTWIRRINDRIQLAPSQVFRSTDSIRLVLINDLLLCPDNGKRHRLEQSIPALDDDNYIAALVEGAGHLCAGDERPIVLLLPMPQFLYSHYQIQLGDEYLNDREMLVSSIALQKDLLLPAFEQELALAAAVGRSEGVAFWQPQKTLDRLNQAFEAADLALIAVVPRTLAVAPESGDTARYVVSDADGSSSAVIRKEEGVATTVLSAVAEEFENPDIRSAWDEKTAPLLVDSPVRMNDENDWLRLGALKNGSSQYAFFTQDFLQKVSGRNRQKRIWTGAAFACAAVFVLSLPFFYQWLDAVRLERLRDSLKQQAQVAIGYDDELRDMEFEWGVVYEYPEADVPGILLALNSVMSNSLTSFSLSESNIEIQGFTREPEKLTGLLVALPIFENIQQSRSTSDSNSGSGDRFGLKLTLANSDYLEYSKKYDFK